jgi:hypothetical protein
VVGQDGQVPLCEATDGVGADKQARTDSRAVQWVIWGASREGMAVYTIAAAGKKWSPWGYRTGRIGKQTKYLRSGWGWPEAGKLGLA